MDNLHRAAVAGPRLAGEGAPRFRREAINPSTEAQQQVLPDLLFRGQPADRHNTGTREDQLLNAAMPGLVYFNDDSEINQLQLIEIIPHPWTRCRLLNLAR